MWWFDWSNSDDYIITSADFSYGTLNKTKIMSSIIFSAQKKNF